MLRLPAALAAAAFFLAVPASAAVVQIDILGKATLVRQPDLEWMTRDLPYSFVDLESQVTRFAGVKTGDEVRFRLTYDSDAVTVKFDEWHGAQEYLMTLPGNASAVLTVGGASYDGLPPGHLGNWSRLGQYSHGYGRIELTSGRAVDAIVREDGEDRIETVHEDLYAYVQLPNVF
ncbi:MAG: hypothetical protein Q4G49_10550, partial [Paracoccus sp. (in: a-proteobacteria)]|nr:hypothetical protein [Paracoccus sp. (in: a-proteobacteria)]